MYEVGDVVMVSGGDFVASAFPLKNMIGVVKSVSPKNGSCGVEFDKALPGMHDCDEKTKKGRGWWVLPSSLTKLLPIKDVVKNLTL